MPRIISILTGIFPRMPCIMRSCKIKNHRFYSGAGELCLLGRLFLQISRDRLGRLTCTSRILCISQAALQSLLQRCLLLFFLRHSFWDSPFSIFSSFCSGFSIVISLPGLNLLFLSSLSLTLLKSFFSVSSRYFSFLKPIPCSPVICP